MSKTYQYRIIVHSRWRFIVYFSLLFCGIGIALLKLLPDHDKLLAYMSMVWMAVSLFVSYWLSRGKIRIVLSEAGIKCYWERRFSLSFAKGWYASWRSVKSYFMYGDRSFDCFVLNFTNGHRFKFHRINIFPIKKDDYKKFTSNFGEKANELMKLSDENSTGLRKCADIYECEEFDDKAIKRRKNICVTTAAFLLLVVLAILVDAIARHSFEDFFMSIYLGVSLAGVFYLEYSALNTHKGEKK